MRKILIVSYHFPPDAAIGALRPAKFAKYLPACGWEPIVLTVREKHYRRTDGSRTADLHHIREIYRTGMPPHPDQLYLRWKALFRRGDSPPDSLLHHEVHTGNARPVGFLKRLIFSLEYLPDDKQVWIPVAVWQGLKIIKARGVDCILTSGPPMSCHVIGLLLHKLAGVRWVADFRDPWLSSSWKGPAERSRLSDIVERWLEGATIRCAAKIVTATHRIQQDFNKRYPFIEPKTETVLNGYDPEDYLSVEMSLAQHDLQVFTLTHAGTMYKNRDATPFLTAISNLIKDGEIPRDRIRVNFIGKPGLVREVVHRLGLADVVKLVDFVDYRSCIQYLCASDVLLLFAQGQPLQIPAKFYDYLAVGKPIIAFTGEGATADLVRQIDCGMIIDSNDPAAIGAKVVDLYTQFEKGTLAGSRPNNSVELTKPALTRKLMAGIG